jgi:CBS domain-containing protein
MELHLEEIRKAIARSSDPDTLRGLRDQIHEQLLAQPLDAFPGDWNDWINTLHDAWIQFAVKKAEDNLLQAGLGPPPLPYAMVLFGSGGRREQTLWSDQDSGLIYEEPEADMKEAADVFFKRLGMEIVEVLFQLGYPPCEGDVMCSNPSWTQSADSWYATIHAWLDEPNWENIRYTLIIADSRCISGDERLGESLKRLLLNRVASDRRLLAHMLRNTLRRKVSLGVLGNLIPERFGEDMGGIDIKYGAYIPLVNAIRLLAISHGIADSNTLDRIAEMERQEAEDPEAITQWRNAVLTVLKLRSLTTSKLEDGFYQSGGILPGSKLTKERKNELKFALKVGQKLHKYVEKEMQDEEI